MFNNAGRFKLAQPAIHVLPPIIVTLVFFELSPNEINLIQVILALVLLQLPWSAYLTWRKEREEKLPVFALIGFMYWIYYAVGIFWGTRTASGKDTPFDQILPDDVITWSLAMAVTGVVSMWLGTRSKVARRFLPRALPVLKDGKTSLHYLRVLLVGGTLLSLSESFAFSGGEGSRQVLTIFISLVPLLAFSILFRRFIRGELAALDKALVVGYLLLRFVVGLSSGWLGAFASIIVVCGAVYVAEKRKVPRLALVLVILFTLFFQVGKKDFRETYWQQGSQAGKVDRVNAWVGMSMEKWNAALTDSTGAGLNDAINSSLSRMSLLTQTANVLDLTPSVVPFQYGRMYSYMLVTFIPRFVWPDKPSINDANQFYQVAYGMSTEEGAESVQIGVGVMTEAYISFGWFGVVGIMFLMGIFYDFYQKIFFAKTSGDLMLGLGVALLPQMIGIEAQMAGYLGGILQQVLLTLLVFLPVIRLSRRHRRLDQYFENAGTRETLDSSRRLVLSKN
jgi:hypothetical protein